MCFVVKYMSVKVFVTDGNAESTARKQKSLKQPTVWAVYLYRIGLPFFVFLKIIFMPQTAAERR